MAFSEIGVCFGVGNEGVGEETLETLSLLMVVMFSLSGFCCTVPLVRIGGVENAFPLCEERGMIARAYYSNCYYDSYKFPLVSKRN